MLPDDSHISSLHFMVECDEKGAVLRDLASRNGMKVNGRVVTAIYLADGNPRCTDSPRNIADKINTRVTPDLVSSGQDSTVRAFTIQELFYGKS